MGLILVICDESESGTCLYIELNIELEIGKLTYVLVDHRLETELIYYKLECVSLPMLLEKKKKYQYQRLKNWNM